jgi:hypothetical protein
LFMAMKSAQQAGSAAILRLAALLLCALSAMSFSFAQTPAKPAKDKKKTTAAITATRRPASPGSRTPVAAAAHARRSSNNHAEASIGAARVGTRKVIVTRKKVHGKWVRTTQIVRAAPGPSYQPHPEPERYQQIQQALASNGYYKGEVNGQWGDDSVDALRRFQADHKLPNDGKISALSLIGLGLGPSHGTIASPAGKEPQPPPASAAVGAITEPADAVNH